MMWSKIPVRRCKECGRYLKHGEWIKIKDPELIHRIKQYGIMETVCPEHETKVFPRVKGLVR